MGQSPPCGMPSGHRPGLVQGRCGEGRAWAAGSVPLSCTEAFGPDARVRLTLDWNILPKFQNLLRSRKVLVVLASYARGARRPGVPPRGWVCLPWGLSLCWLVVSDLLPCGCGHRPGPGLPPRDLWRRRLWPVAWLPARKGRSLSVQLGQLAGRCDWPAGPPRQAAGASPGLLFFFLKASSVGRFFPPVYLSFRGDPLGCWSAESPTRVRQC